MAPPSGLSDRLSANRSRGHGSSRLPRPKQWSNGRIVLVAAIALVFMVGVVGLVLWTTGVMFQRAPYSGLTATVKREQLKITIVARGSLESSKNNDIVCKVRSGTKGSTVATSIKWLVDNGSPVEEDQVIMELDDSGLKEQLKSQNRVVDESKADEVKAAEQYRIDDIQCTSDIEKAENARDLARLDLEKYVKGDYEQALKDVNGRIETSRSDLESWKDRSAWSDRMFRKGLMSKVQADADSSRFDGARIALEKVEEEKRVLVDYTKKRTIQDLTAKVAEAERNLEKTKIQTKAQLASDKAVHNSKKSIFDQELAKKLEIEAEILKCIVKAPQDGLVVYFVPEQVRGGGGSQQSIVAQGEPVREGQKMMQIPDLKKMMVNVRVPEAFVSHLTSEDDPHDKSTWQVAQIRVDAFPNRVLQGHVKTVDTVASAQDFFASDVKVYKTMVKVDDHLEGMRPGMSAEVTIFAAETPDPVLVIPIQAVLGTINMGAKRKCFVIDRNGQPEMRDIVVGMSNERVVEVKSGLEEGERVVENPTPLVGENSDLKAGKLKSGSPEEGDSGNGGDGKKKKAASKKKADGPAIPGGPGGPGAGGPGPGGPGPGAPVGPGGAPTAEQKELMKKMMLEKATPMTPAQRREMVNAVPEAFRPQVLQLLKENSLEVAP